MGIFFEIKACLRYLFAKEFDPVADFWLET